MAEFNKRQAEMMLWHEFEEFELPHRIEMFIANRIEEIRREEDESGRRFTTFELVGRFGILSEQVESQEMKLRQNFENYLPERVADAEMRYRRICED